jgi:hypothetical protein
MTRWLFAALLSVVVLAACGDAQPSGVGVLPTWDPGGFCPLAELLYTTIHVDPSADPPVWATHAEGGRTYLEWPVGFTLHLSGGVAEIVDPDGVAVVRDGGRLSSALGGGASARGEDWFSVCGIGSRLYTTD